MERYAPWIGGQDMAHLDFESAHFCNSRTSEPRANFDKLRCSKEVSNGFHDPGDL